MAQAEAIPSSMVRAESMKTWRTSLKTKLSTSKKMTTDSLLSDFAIRSFRDEGDADYISARMAFRAAISPSLWASQQMIEKYLKCILLLNRIPGKDVRHNLRKALNAINNSGKLSLDLTPATQEFIEYIDTYGTYRYLEVSKFFNTRDIINLDRTAWELRRYCTLDPAPRQTKLDKGVPAPKIHLPGGYLEGIIDNINDPARRSLIWQNAFFGKRQRKSLKGMTIRLKAINAPLYLNPQILDDVLKYVYFPKALEAAYRTHTKPT